MYCPRVEVYLYIMSIMYSPLSLLTCKFCLLSGMQGGQLFGLRLSVGLDVCVCRYECVKGKVKCTGQFPLCKAHLLPQRTRSIHLPLVFSLHHCSK